MQIAFCFRLFLVYWEVNQFIVQTTKEVYYVMSWAGTYPIEPVWSHGADVVRIEAVAVGFLQDEVPLPLGGAGREGGIRHVALCRGGQYRGGDEENFTSLALILPEKPNRLL